MLECVTYTVSYTLKTRNAHRWTSALKIVEHDIYKKTIYEKWHMNKGGVGVFIVSSSFFLVF